MPAAELGSPYPSPHHPCGSSLFSSHAITGKTVHSTLICTGSIYSPFALAVSGNKLYVAGFDAETGLAAIGGANGISFYFDASTGAFTGHFDFPGDKAKPSFGCLQPQGFDDLGSNYIRAPFSGGVNAVGHIFFKEIGVLSQNFFPLRVMVDQ